MASPQYDPDELKRIADEREQKQGKSKVQIDAPEKLPASMVKASAPRKSQIDFDAWRALLGSVRTAGDLRTWLLALSRELAGDAEKADAKSGIDRWYTRLGKAPQDATLASLEKEWGNLMYTADSLLHHATGRQRSFDPSWSETVMNALRASGDAVMVAANTTKDLARDAAKGLSWTFVALPLLAAVGIGTYAYAMGRK